MSQFNNTTTTTAWVTSMLDDTKAERNDGPVLADSNPTDVFFYNNNVGEDSLRSDPMGYIVYYKYPSRWAKPKRYVWAQVKGKIFESANSALESIKHTMENSDETKRKKNFFVHGQKPLAYAIIPVYTLPAAEKQLELVSNKNYMSSIISDISKHIIETVDESKQKGVKQWIVQNILKITSRNF